MPSTGPNAFAANIDVFRLTRSLSTANWLTQFGSVKWLNVSEDIEDALAVNDRWVPWITEIAKASEIDLSGRVRVDRACRHLGKEDTFLP